MSVAIFMLAAITYPQPAYAYVDPGTGSMIIHIIVGAIAGGLMTVKIYWHNIKQLLSHSKPNGKEGQIKETE